MSERAKQPVSVVAGPYGHPFHPVLIPVPIGAWVTSVVFDFASLSSPEAFASAARWAVGIGILGALLAAVFGFLDLLAIPRGTRAFRTAVTHMSLNLVVVAAFVVSFLARDGAGATETWLIVLSLVALALLGVSGWLGGELSYRYGVRVANERTQAEGFAEARGA